MEKIKMTTPLVEMDGDEMTRILWKMIKDELLFPYIDLKTEYYDLGLEHRNETNDQVTIDSALANKKYGVAVKCATITPNAARMTEYNLKEMWKSPNGTIRAIMDGTVFRTPIVVKGIEPCVRNWKKPITLARHAYGDVYKASEIKVPCAGKAELVFTAEDGTETRELIHEFDGPGVLQPFHPVAKFPEEHPAAVIEIFVVYPHRQHKMPEFTVGHAVAPGHLLSGLKRQPHILQKIPRIAVHHIGPRHICVKKLEGIPLLTVAKVSRAEKLGHTAVGSRFHSGVEIPVDTPGSLIPCSGPESRRATRQYSEGG